ncbi:hypothetical protein ES703_54070 [subsurface metagenome]
MVAQVVARTNPVLGDAGQAAYKERIGEGNPADLRIVLRLVNNDYRIIDEKFVGGPVQDAAVDNSAFNVWIRHSGLTP